MKKDVTKDIKESCNRLGFEKGPWSSWLTPVEAKRRFSHAEEIAGSNPAGPTTRLSENLFAPFRGFSVFSVRFRPSLFFLAFFVLDALF